MIKDFLPMTSAECTARGWEDVDFVYVTGDAYVDHPSFGVAIISRVLENAGFRVAILAQPNWRNTDDFKRFGKPRLGFLVTSGNIDSMVAHYTASKKKRSYDYYSPGGKIGLRPDRAVIVYCNMIRQAYGDVPIILGGLEASLRRCAHYDYWDNKVRRSILVDSRADILTYGMGENILLRIAALLDKGVPVKKIRDVRGTAVLCERDYTPNCEFVHCGEYDDIKNDKKLYAEAFKLQYVNNDHINGKAITEGYDTKLLVQNPPMPPLEREELDKVYSLPYMRDYHPSYEKDGGVPAIAEVKFSITHNRGCFGGCAFCALAYHQGRTVRSRSIKSVVREAEIIASMPDFKGYIHDVGGPTANFRHGPCQAVRDGKKGVCNTRRCLSPTPCKNLIADHREYVDILRKISALPKIKKVFIRSGVRFDYVMADKDDTFLNELVSKHVSGQLKVAPEHISPNVLRHMGKPNVEIYNAFCKKYFETTEKCGLEQYLVPYLMSSHPGSTLSDAIDLALYLKKERIRPEQVQDFYPTPGTASTAMYYTGIDPFSGKDVYVPKSYEEKQMQRALLQYNRKENRPLIEKAIRLSERYDACLPLLGIRPDLFAGKSSPKRGGTSEKRAAKDTVNKRTKNAPPRRSSKKLNTHDSSKVYGFGASANKGKKSRKKK